MGLWKPLLYLSFLVLHEEGAWARMNIVPGSRYTSGRGAAMGDAFIPIADDGAGALFYQPAAIGKVRGPQAEPFNFSFYGNDQFGSLVGIKTATNIYKVTSLSSFLPTLQQNPGKFASIGASVAPMFYMRQIAFGVLMQNQMGAQVNQDGTVHYKSLYQAIPTFGTALRLASGIVRLGYSLQWVNQASGDFNNIPATTDPMGYNQRLAQGTAISHNLGFALTLPFRYLPSLNVVARNVLSAKFTEFSLFPLARNHVGVPPTEPMTLDASFSIQPKAGLGGYFNWVFEYRDLTNTSKTPYMARIAPGVEFSFRDNFFLRGGFGGGYPSAGIGLRKKGGEFAITWYSEDIGPTYHSHRDIRFMIHYQVRAF